MPQFEEKERLFKRSHSINAISSSETTNLFQTDQSSLNYGSFPTFSCNLPSSYLFDKREHFKRVFIKKFKFQIESYVSESSKRKEEPSKTLSLLHKILAGLVGTAIGFCFQLEGELLSRLLYQSLVVIGMLVFSVIFSKTLYFHQYRMLKKLQQRAKRISGATYFLRNDSAWFEKTLEEVSDTIFLKLQEKIDVLEGYNSGGLDVAMDALAKAAVGRAMNYIDKNADSLQNKNIGKEELVKAIFCGKPEMKGLVRRRAGDKLYFQENNKLVKVRAGDVFNFSDIASEDT